MTMSIAWLRRSRSSVSKSRCGPRGSGEVVDGHLRLKAAKKLGMTEVPMILHDEWIEAQVKAFRLMVNRSVGWAGWDEELLGLELWS
jgi:ParB-like chromosome segregation protein Spo0J